MSKLIGLTVMALSGGFLLGAVATGSPGLWTVLCALLAMLGGSLLLTTDWIPEVQIRRRQRRLQDRRWASLRGPGTAIRDRSLEKRWLQ
jgi:hypothetical protein